MNRKVLIEVVREAGAFTLKMRVVQANAERTPLFTLRVNQGELLSALQARSDGHYILPPLVDAEIVAR